MREVHVYFERYYIVLQEGSLTLQLKKIASIELCNKTLHLRQYAYYVLGEKHFIGFVSNCFAPMLPIQYFNKSKLQNVYWFSYKF